jgi:SulP family sulfate permease
MLGAHIAVLAEIPGSGGQWADTAVHPEDRTVPGITVLRVESGVFFGNADHVRAVIEDAANTHGTGTVVLDCESMPYLDVTAARMLTQLAADLNRRAVRLVLAGEIGQVRDMLAAVSDKSDPAGTPEFHRTVRDAVEAAVRAAERPQSEVATGDNTTPGRRHG